MADGGHCTIMLLRLFLWSLLRLAVFRPELSGVVADLAALGADSATPGADSAALGADSAAPNAAKTLVWGPGLDPNIVLPARFFFIQAVDLSGRK